MSLRCEICGTVVTGPAIRVRHGFVEYHKRGVVFHEDPYEDGTIVKWLHPRCVPKVFATSLEIERCSLCGQQFFFTEPSESVLYLEGGEVGQDFVGIEGGVAHFLCACEDWNLPTRALRGELI